MKRNIIINKGRASSLRSTLCRSANALLLTLPAFIVFTGCSYIREKDTGRTSGQVYLTTLHIKAGEEDGTGESGLSGGVADVFIFNDDDLRRIDSYQRLEIGAGNTVDAASRKGDKIVVLIYNPQQESYDWSSISSYESISAMYSDLRLENAATPLMSGTVRINAADDCSFDIPVQPLLSEIFLRSIRCDFAGRPYAGAKLENVFVYLSNVNSLAKVISTDRFIPNAPLNSDGLPYDAWNSMKNPEMVYADLDRDIGKETVYPEIRLYCYPNSSEEDTAGTPFTRLVIAGDIEGKRYYYPININKGEFGEIGGCSGIGRNCRYVLDVTIRQTGVTDPDIAVSGERVQIALSTEPWDSLPETEIEF